jgi:hypothetical protein
MSDTDIYKKRETIHVASDGRTRKPSRRRPATSESFGRDKQRRRRSKNTGLRRLIHLSRKSENEKFFWWGLLVCVVVLLVISAAWQFWYTEHVAREMAKKNDAVVPIQHLEPARTSAAE